VRYEVGEVMREDLAAPRALSFESQTLTQEARSAARAAVPPQFDYTADNAIAIANEQASAFTERVRRVDTAFATDLSPEERAALLETAIPGLSDTTRASLQNLDAPRWAAIRTEAARVLDATLRTELRDTEVADTRATIAGRMGGDLDEAERMLAGEIIRPLVVPNSSFSQTLWDQARDRAAEEVRPVRVDIAQARWSCATGPRSRPQISR